MNSILKKRINNLIRKHFIDIDISERSTIFISGMGRSGTTWLSELINYDNKYRDIFEPFYPYKVSIAKKFKYLQYLNSNNQSIELINSAKLILSGNIRSDWSDVTINRFFYNKRIIKDIRTNLILGWLKNIRSTMPIILIMRNPYSVIDSYKELGWGIEAGGDESDYNRIIQQSELLNDFPFFNEIINSIKSDDYISKLAFQWCVFYYVPLKQLKNGDFILVQYESLLLNPKETLNNIFEYLKQNVNVQSILDKIEKPSITNYRGTHFDIDKYELITNWKKSISKNEITKINKMIKSFKLNNLYDKNGYPLNNI